MSGGRLAIAAAVAAVFVGVFAPSAFAVPSVWITSAPPVQSTSTSATFAWTLGGDAAYSRCALVSSTSWGSYTSCTSPKTYSGLAPGNYTFYVRALNYWGQYVTATYGFTVLSGSAPPPPPPSTVTAPTVTLSSTPASGTTATTASFAWTATGGPTSTTCSLDGGTATSCASPRSYSGLAVGTHTFRVTVSNSAGSASQSYSWSIAAPAPAPTGTTPSGCTPGSDWGTRRADYETRVAELVNQHRQSLGLRALTISPTLAASAHWKALHMARYGYMAHDDPAPPVARTAGQRIAACGFSGRGWGENIAYGYRTPEYVMQGWLNSPGHRANIENPYFTVIGVGAASYYNGYMYWAQNFGY